MKARVVPTQNLPWDTTHVRRKIAEAKAFINRSLHEHSLASTERNKKFSQRLSELNSGAICFVNNNMRKEIEMHMENERVVTRRHMEALIKYIDELGLGDFGNDLKQQLIAVAAQTGAYSGTGEGTSRNEAFNPGQSIPAAGVLHPVAIRPEPVHPPVPNREPLQHIDSVSSLMLPGEVEVDEMANPVLPSVPIRMSMGSFGQFYLNGGLANVPRPDENMGFVHLGKTKERDFDEGGEIIIYEGKRAPPIELNLLSSFGADNSSSSSVPCMHHGRSPFSIPGFTYEFASPAVANKGWENMTQC
ncbi:uncharacterized protein LOC119298233 [Triticum dicoccoides]|uniref:uncharacterized protein LOC119298233 n=1 Tax=Triticum dicoccoides TaxID=85692 RepID=UPI00188F5CAD|nr:uncharacterized protein LOC119298233 [Triticum dicoccoides]